MKQTVLFLCGGRSDEHEISLISAKAILDALDRTRFTPIVVGIARDGAWHLEAESSYYTGAFRADTIYLNTESPKVALFPFCIEGRGQLVAPSGNIPFDVVFPILHGPFGEDGTIQGLFDIVGIPYVGSGCGSSHLCMDKELTKVMAKAHALPIVDYYVVKDRSELKQSQVSHLGIPVFVKPARLGSSVGISKANSLKELESAVATALKYDSKVLIEKAIKGREIECAVLGTHLACQASLPGEIVPSPEVGWYSYEAKYLIPNGARTLTPARLSEPMVLRIQTLATRTFQVMECEGMARVDMFLDETHDLLYLNEVNTIPGFTPISMYPKMWEATGLSYKGLVSKLLELAMASKRT